MNFAIVSNVIFTLSKSLTLKMSSNKQIPGPSVEVVNGKFANNLKVRIECFCDDLKKIN